MLGFTDQADIYIYIYCVGTKNDLGREGGPFFAISFWCGVFVHTAGLPSGLLLLLLLLLMCSSSRNMETTQRLGIGNVTDHRLWRMANMMLKGFYLICGLTWVKPC